MNLRFIDGCFLEDEILWRVRVLLSTGSLCLMFQRLQVQH